MFCKNSSTQYKQCIPDQPSDQGIHCLSMSLLLDARQKWVKNRAGPRRSEDGGALPKACIERRKPREGESMRGGFPSYKGIRASPGKFLKLDCLRVHFHAIFKSFSLTLQADFIFFFLSISGGRGSKTAGTTFFCGIILSFPLIQEEQLSVSGKRICTVLVNHLCISLPRKCGYVN